MIELCDIVEIDVPPGVVHEWLADMGDHFLSLHPDHLSCRRIAGSPGQVGEVLAIDERLHRGRGPLPRVVRKIVPGIRIDYTIGVGCQGTYMTLPHCGRCDCERTVFTATVHLGSSRLPFLDPFLRGEVAMVRRHMWEEGQNLRRIIAGPIRADVA